MTEVEALRIAVVACLVAIGGLIVALRWTAARTGRENRRRQRLASRAEREAERWLVGLGWEVVERQSTAVWSMWVDGEEREVSCRADLVVRRPGRRGRWVAEVKTGERAPSPTFPATRRQLLEYVLAFDVEGVLLLDMERRRVRQVAFPNLVAEVPERSSWP